MNDRAVQRLDLNLMIALDALLAERSVTRAAERLGLSQPALSASLARLRRHFDDPLLVRQGNTYVLSDLATRLRGQVGVALDAAEDVFRSRQNFDPQRSQRTFRLIGSDYAIAALGGPVLDLLHEQAPLARLRLDQFDAHRHLLDVDSLTEVDGLVLPHGVIADLPFVDLFSDGWVCLSSADNDFFTQSFDVTDRADIERIARRPWVMTYRDGSIDNVGARSLQTHAVELEPVLTVDTFLALPPLLRGSDRSALLLGRMARRMTALGDLRVDPFPFPMNPITEALWWHPEHTADPEHAWFRDLVATAAANVPKDV